MMLMNSDTPSASETVAETDLPAHIFREYDIRGEVPNELNEAVVIRIARAFAHKVAAVQGIAAPTISVGWDGRLSSPALAKAVCEGLMQGGAQVLQVGLGPTPLTYYSVFECDTDGCVMLTGSHNPPNYNGLKLMVGKKPFFGQMIQALYAEIQAENFPEVAAGQTNACALFDTYVQTLRAAAGSWIRPLKVVWDAGNGASGEVLNALVAQLDGSHEVLFGEIDGTFPNHHPDPSVEANMQDLRNRVLASKADIGIAFDGDGDRIGVIDAMGRIWAGDQILAVLARSVLRANPGAEIMVDVKTSQGVLEAIESYGGRGVIYKTGHSNIKSKMAEIGAPLAGEMSGHIFFADRYVGIDDALYAACRLLDVLGNSDESSSALYDMLPSWQSTPEIRIDCAEDKKFQVIHDIAQALKREGADFLDIDGVRVNTDAGWWLLRASNTQPVLVARAEAKTPDALAQLTDELTARLQPYGITL